MIDFTPWDKLQEFDMETTATLWYASANNVEILDKEIMGKVQGFMKYTLFTPLLPPTYPSGISVAG